MDLDSYDQTGEPAYIIIDPHDHVIVGPISLNALLIGIFIALIFSSYASIFFFLLLGLFTGLLIFVLLFFIFLILSLNSLGDYPEIPLILVNPRRRKFKFIPTLFGFFVTARIGFFSVVESNPSLAVDKVTGYLDSRKKRQTAFLFIANEKAWSRHSDFIQKFVEDVKCKFPNVNAGFLCKPNELDKVPKGICKVPFSRHKAIQDLLWYLAEASIKSNENGFILNELFSSSNCILYFAPRQFEGLRWKSQFQFHPFTPETAIRWIDALLERYCLTDVKLDFSKSYVIFRLPYGDSIPLTHTIVKEVERKLEVRPRVFEVNCPLGIRKNTPQIILGGIKED